MMAFVLVSLNPHNHQVCEHFMSTQQVGRPPKVIHPAKEGRANKLLKKNTAESSRSPLMTQLLAI